MYNKALHNLLPRAEGLLSGLLMGLEMDIECDKKGIIKTIAEAKALINETELILKQDLDKELLTAEK